MQITIADVDQDGRALPTGTTFALCGPVRAMGESDDSLNRLATKAGRAYLCTALLLCADVACSSPERLVIPKVDALCIAPTSLYHCSLFLGREYHPAIRCTSCVQYMRMPLKGSGDEAAYLSGSTVPHQSLCKYAEMPPTHDKLRADHCHLCQ